MSLSLLQFFLFKKKSWPEPYNVIVQLGGEIAAEPSQTIPHLLLGFEFACLPQGLPI